MGGCRCIFQNCKVSTSRQSGMHFFHFPLKDKDRYFKWLEMAAAKEILHLPIDKQKNKVICARHFYDEDFMNYKKDRLMPKAIPTITRLSDVFAWDYAKIDSDGKPELIYLEKSSMAHLIPPKDFKCPFQFSEEEKLQCATLLQEINNKECYNGAEEIEFLPLKERIATPTDTTTNLSTALQQQTNKRIGEKRTLAGNNEDSAVTQAKILRVESIEEKQKVHSFDISESEKSYETEVDVEQNEVVLYELCDWDENDIEIPNNNKQPVSNMEESKQNEDTVVDATEKDASSHLITSNDNCEETVSTEDEEEMLSKIKAQAATIEELKAHIVKLENQLKSANTQTENVSSELKTSKEYNKQFQQQVAVLESTNKDIEIINAKLKYDVNNWKDKHHKLLNELENNKSKQHKNSMQIERLQKEHELLLDKYQKMELQQQQVVSTSKECKDSIALAATNLTKAQIFNGIRKYLSASMIALVRMEMFGNAERQWKPDERRVAVELLRLGDTVFTYFSDEWRLRLPTLREVQSWLRDANSIDDEEDL